MKQEEGIIRVIGPRLGFIRSPGKKDRIFYPSDAPPGIDRWKSVRYKVMPQPMEKHDRAVDIQLMEVA